MALSSLAEISALPHTSKSSLPSPLTSTASIPLTTGKPEELNPTELPWVNVPSPFPRSGTRV